LTSQPNAVALGQELLEGMLAKAILDRFGVKIDHEAELTSMDIGDDKVTAHLQITNTDGTTSTQTAEAQYLVGTDGGHSRVRKELKVPFDGEVLPGTMIYGDIRVEGLEAGVSHAWSDDVKGR
jgi:2-polyprenyl-6-methoxyphenol hydroxylase-like FAD-dependent oxidoreductase